MTIQSGFFNSINGDRKYDATWFAQYFASFIGNGVFPNPSTNLQVLEASNMDIVVSPGKGWINGYYVVNDNEYTLTLDSADGVLKRIDRVVMRLNYLTRQIEIDVKKGEFASNPVAPTLQRDADMHELALADVLINNGATAITQANITDTRLNNELCGIVHGVVDQIDTTTLFNQYQSWFNEYTEQSQQEFEDWFATLVDILDGEVATNLTNRILQLENNKVDKSSVGQAEGVAPLDNEAKLPFENLPDIKGKYEVITSTPFSSTTQVVLENLDLQDYARLRLTISELYSTSIQSVDITLNNAVAYFYSSFEGLGSNPSSQSSVKLTNSVSGLENNKSTIVIDISNMMSAKSGIVNGFKPGGTIKLSGVIFGCSIQDFVNKITLNFSASSNGVITVEGVKR